jgi:hypothetical protein
MSKIAARLLAVAVLLCAARVASAETVTIKNASKFDIHHFFLSPQDQNHWGADQLGDHVLAAGGTFELSEVPCDSYDVKLVDEDGDECVLQADDICGSDETWSIGNEGLLECEGFGG